jgi:hypothetical protein
LSQKIASSPLPTGRQALGKGEMIWEYMKKEVECKAKRSQDTKKDFGPVLQITITKNQILNHDLFANDFWKYYPCHTGKIGRVSPA